MHWFFRCWILAVSVQIREHSGWVGLPLLPYPDLRDAISIWEAKLRKIFSTLIQQCRKIAIIMDPKIVLLSKVVCLSGLCSCRILQRDWSERSASRSSISIWKSEIRVWLENWRGAFFSSLLSSPLDLRHQNPIVELEIHFVFLPPPPVKNWYLASIKYITDAKL